MSKFDKVSLGGEEFQAVILHEHEDSVDAVVFGYNDNAAVIVRSIPLVKPEQNPDSVLVYTNADTVSPTVDTPLPVE